jgi:hypothetical protein
MITVDASSEVLPRHGRRSSARRQACAGRSGGGAYPCSSSPSSGRESSATGDNDAGGIATYSLAGAQFGTATALNLIPITVALIIGAGDGRMGSRARVFQT